MAAAGLWEGWRGPGDEIIRSFTILTTTANAALRHLHERMPVVLEQADFPLWLGEASDAGAAGDVAALMRPAAMAFRVWRVSTAVTNVRHDRADLLDEVGDLMGEM